MYSTDPVASAAAAEGTPQISITLVNPATGQSTLENGVAATLSVQLSNTGSAIALQSGSALELYFPQTPYDVDAAALQGMAITLENWTFSCDTTNMLLRLDYSGPAGGEWAGNLQFDITNVLVTDPSLGSGTAEDGTFQVNFRRLPGAPAMLTTGLQLVAPPQPGNLSLADVLQVSLDSRGSVYVSTAVDPLANRLFLNIKNIGDTPLFTGPGTPSGAMISVSFVYGNTSGALAPAESTRPTTPPLGSAWNIVAGVYVDQTQGWSVRPSDPADSQPKFRMVPQPGNTNLIGTGSAANVTFDFTDIVSLTAIGHTQMTVTFSGFQQSDSRLYDPLVVVMDIAKLTAPPVRGLLSLFSTDNPVIPVAAADTPVTIPLRWSMAEVNSIQLITSWPGMTPYQRVYAQPPATPAALGYDTTTVTIPSTTQSGPVTMTMQALDAQGGYLNALQYTCYLQMMVFVDPRDNQSYPITLLGGRYWMTKNLNYNEQGSLAYNDDPKNAATYGRLYTANSPSVVAPPAGWHVPSADDWNALIAAAGGAATAWQVLSGTGPGQFAAQLGGRYEPSSTSLQYQYLLVSGNYHLLGGQGNLTYTAFNSPASQTAPSTVFEAGGLKSGYALSIRYCRNP